MTREFYDSPVEGGANPTFIEEGRIYSVNMKRWTVDVKTLESQRSYLDIQWSSPYFHFSGGEGIFCMPEVGAKVMICRPAYTGPFVLCFVGGAEQPTNQESTSDTPTSSGDQTGTSEMTYRGGRPYLQQGDLMMRTRDGNYIWLRRGGVVEIGSTAVAKRIYIPILNYIRDICENYSMWSGGGVMTWTVSRSDENPEDEATAVLSIAAKNAAQHAKASALIRIGHVDDTQRLKISVAPQNITTDTFEVSDAVYDLEIDKEGTVVESVGKDHTVTVAGDLDWTISGSASIKYNSGLTMDVEGDYELSVSGEHKLEAASSNERITGGKVVDCPNIQLGGTDAVEKLCLANPALFSFLLGHTHPVTGTVAGPTTSPLVPATIQARKVSGS